MISWSHARSRRRDQLAGRPVSSERGETLIEVMCTVILMGTGFVAILSAILTATNVADANHQRTKASIAVQAFAESLLQPIEDRPRDTAPTALPQEHYYYKPCAAWSGAYGVIDSGSGLLPDKYTATITKIRYFTGTFDASGPVFTDPSLSESAAVSQCYASFYVGKTVKDNAGNPATMYVDKGLQEITVRIDSGPRRDRVIDTLVVVKRDQRCPGTYDNADLGPC